MGRRHILKDFLERGFDPKKAHSRLDSSGRLVGDTKKVVKAVEIPAVVAEPVAVEPDVVKEVELVRAREEDGQFLADDPATPDVDEAWIETPVKPMPVVEVVPEPEPVVAPAKPKRTPRKKPAAKKPAAKSTRARRTTTRKTPAKKPAED